MFTLKVCRASNKSLFRILSRSFAQVAHNETAAAINNNHHNAKESHHHDEHHAVESIADKEFDKQLQGYSHIFGGPTVQDSKLSAQMLIAHNPVTKSKAFLEFMARELQYSKVENENEYFRAPKIHENAVFLYQSKAFANSVRAIRGAEYAYAFFVTALMKQPWFFIPTFGFFYLMFANAYFYEMSRRLVVRMDLLPHLEMVHFQKISAFGEPYSKLVRIENLEKVNVEEYREKENYFWVHNVQLDVELIFRDKETKELYCFDRDAYWDWKGISHELLY